MYGELNFPSILSPEFVLLFLKLISRKISNISSKIISVQNVNPSKYNRHSEFPAVNSGKRLYTTVGREFIAVYGQTSQCQVFGAGNLTKTSQNNVAKYDILLACLHSRKAGRLHKRPKRIILLLCSERLVFLKLLLSRISRILPFHATTTNDNLWEE